MKFSIVLPRVALADSLSRGYCLKPLRGFRKGVGHENVMFPRNAVHPGERAGSIGLVGLMRGRPRIMGAS